MSNTFREAPPEDSSARYRIGTRFLRVVTGWGLCEGIINSFDGKYYSVEYISMNMEETLVDEKILDDAIIITNWNTHLLDEGQQVWVFMGKGRHSGVIMSIRRLDNKASVKWDSTNKVGEVDLDTVFPMFEYDSEGSLLTSSYSKRKRTPTNFFHRGLEEQVPRAFQTPKGSKQNETGTDNRSERCSIKIEYKETREAPLNCKDEKKGAYSKKRKPAKTRPQAQKKNWDEKSNPNILKSSCTPNSAGLGSPGLGWAPKYDVWIHPKLGLELTLDQARKFQHISDSLGGDEEAAYVEYKKSLTSEQTDNTKSAHKAPTVKDEDEEEEKETSEDFEQELSMLYDYYLNQKVRKDEEIPSGMSITSLQVGFPANGLQENQCSSKGGQKACMIMILAWRTGDGPSDLIEEFLGKETDRMHHEVEIVEPNKPDTAPEAVIVEDLSVGMFCDQTTVSSLSESPPVTASATLNDHNAVNNQIVGDDKVTTRAIPH
ncbi:hypothetical protein HJC23_008111 [Cyclotella cryptica]|uniref:Uncharacterized protein n=1 Tax=Cyclotella cryptica TaxID=29204 RepID=A0ABD3PF48_9STRA